VAYSTNQFIQLATGLNRWDEASSSWVPAQAEFVLTADGYVVCDQTQHRVILAPDLASSPAVDLLTPEGLRLQSSILGVALLNPETGQSLMLGATKSCPADCVGPGEVLFSDALDGLRADVRYRIALDRFEQDLILREQIPVEVVQAAGADPATARLLVLTEFFQSPEPVVETRRFPSASGREVTDADLVFGSMRMGLGAAFALPDDGGSPEPGSAPSRVRVFKSWEQLDGRQCLVEWVDYAALAPLMEALPVPGQARVDSMKARLKRMAALAPNGGQRSEVREQRAEAGGQKTAWPAGRPPALPVANPAAEPSTREGAAVALAEANPLARPPGVVLDYTQLLSTNNFTLRADTTYLVMGNVNLSGTTTIEGCTVVKFTNSTNARLAIAGSVNCQTGPYRPAVFTAIDDNTVGEPLNTNSPSATNYYGNGLELSTSGQSLAYLRLAFAGQAITSDPEGGELTLSHAQFVACRKALNLEEDTVLVRNGLFHRVQNVVAGRDLALRAQHLTVHECDEFLHARSGENNLCLTNSLLVGITNGWGNYDSLTTNMVVFNPPEGDAAFQAVGAGAHYLPEESPYRGAGADYSLLDWDLCGEFQSKTTDPPVLLSGPISLNTVLRTHARRDYWLRKSGTLDLGYHYDPLDYVVSGLAVTNATLVLTNGVAVGTFGAGGYGIWLRTGGKVVSEGSPTNLNHLVRYNTVQEQATTNWSSTTVPPTVGSPYTGSPAPQASFRFTSWSLLGGPGYHVYTDPGAVSTALAFTDCQFTGGGFAVERFPVALTNCLWERVALDLSDDGTSVDRYVFNNLFRGGSLHLQESGNGTRRIKDNLFDRTTLYQDGSWDHGYNAYVTNCNRLTPIQGTDKVLTNSPVYLASYLGAYYYPTNDGMLSTLINAGSRCATNAGLYHFTTQSNQSKEANSMVDIGFHYVASPMDTDGDGLADYVEDRNGNGIWDQATETRWENVVIDNQWYPGADTDGDSVFDGQEVMDLGTNPMAVDTDGDSKCDNDEYLVGGDPLDGNSLTALRLSYWRFDTTNTASLTNEAGVFPLQATNVLMTNSFEGFAPDFCQTGTILRYPCLQGTNITNIDFRFGAVRFSYQPNWYHGTNTNNPGVPCTLCQVGAWKLSITANGRWLVFESPTACGGTNENLRVPLPRAGETPFGYRTNWEIVLNYSPGGCLLLLNGKKLDTGYGEVGWGTETNPSASDLALGLHIGCSPGGTNPAQGVIDEFETFNWPVGAVVPTMCDTPFARLWDAEERRSQVLVAAAPANSNQIDLRSMRGFEGDPQQCPTNYVLHRRQWGATNWDLVTTNLITDHYSDTGATPGLMYEYRVNRLANSPTTAAALRANPMHCRGKALVLVDTNVEPYIGAELAQFREDLRLDGWVVPENDTIMPRHADFDTNQGYTLAGYTNDLKRVKTRIQQESGLDVVVLVGHITIPYSGDAAEDGHLGCGAHEGAWPADLWYGDLDGDWTDNQNTNTCYQPLANTSGDWKLDQNEFPTNSNGVRKLEVAVGRIDFANMPAFIGASWLSNATDTASTERALIKNYFQKARWWRSKQTTVTDTWRQFIQNPNFDDLVQAPRSLEAHLNGNLAAENRPFDDVFATAAQYGGHSYLWGIHGASGWPDSISNEDTSGTKWRYAWQLAYTEYEPQVAFYLLSGSWIGDWNWCSWPSATNGFLRACLSTPHYGLAALWAFEKNQPHTGPWKLDRLGLGLHIGAALQDTISANASQSCRALFILGDPTLAGYIVAPPTNLGAVKTNGGWQVSLSWNGSSEATDGYYAYRGTNVETAIANRLGWVVSGTTNFLDTTIPTGQTNDYVYLVRAATLTTSGGGSFTNLSRAAQTTIHLP